MKHYALSLFALIAIWGCSGSTETPPTTTTGGTAPKTETTGTTASTPAPGAAEVPAEIKHDGFAYFGLDNTATMNVEMALKGQPVKTGGITAKLEKVENGVATYSIARTGGIAADLGTDTIVVDKTGVYITGTSVGTIKPEKSLQLPADLKTGSTWQSNSSVTKTDGTELSDNSTYTVKGIEKLTTKVGSYDALVVTSTGTGSVKVGGETHPATYNTVSYYVKNRGLVKQIINLAIGKQAPNSVTIEESK